MAFSVEVSIAVHSIQIQLTPASMIKRAEYSHISSLNQREAKKGLLFSSVNIRRAYIPTRVQTEIRLAWPSLWQWAWLQKIRKSVPFRVLMKWKKGKRHTTEYNFYITNIESNNSKKKSQTHWATYSLEVSHQASSSWAILVTEHGNLDLFSDDYLKHS